MKVLSTICVTFSIGLWLSLSAVMANGNDSVLAKLLQNESAGRANISAYQFDRLLTLPKSAAEADRDFLYSKAWLKTQPAPRQSKQWACLTEAIYFEARGESIKGQFAVAEVILNRVTHHSFPDTVCKVVNQGTGRRHACQFSYTCDGKAEYVGDKKAYLRAGKIARALLDGAPATLTGGATFYHTKAVNPYWAAKFEKLTSIGFHHFYRHPG